jgi:hypothetical protein
MGRNLILIGAVIIVIGLVWPWMQKLGLGRLPGDIVITRGHTRFVFPIVTSLILSLLLSLILWLFRR